MDWVKATLENHRQSIRQQQSQNDAIQSQNNTIMEMLKVMYDQMSSKANAGIEDIMPTMEAEPEKPAANP